MMWTGAARGAAQAELERGHLNSIGQRRDFHARQPHAHADSHLRMPMARSLAKSGALQFVTLESG